MKIKKGLDLTTDDFFYDLFEGYLDPDKICQNREDAKSVWKAMKIIEDFKLSCELEIEDFIR